jgi:hypothetical protein
MCLCCDINRTCLLRADRVECEWIIDVCCGYIYKVLKKKNKRVCVLCCHENRRNKKWVCCHACSGIRVCACVKKCMGLSAHADAV